MDNTHHKYFDKQGIFDERAQRILDEAMRLMLHYGFEKTTMNDIATAAGVSKSTLYLYWKSKDDLFRALLIYDFLDMFNDWLERVQADPKGGTLYGIYHHGFLSLIAHPFSSSLYTKENHLLGDYIRRREPGAYVRPYLLNLSFVQKLQASGLVRTDIQVEIINHILTLISVGLFSIGELIPQEYSPPFEEVAKSLAQMVHRSLATAQAENSELGKKTLQEYLIQLTQGFKQDN